ncbi:MAG TPA: Gfo/Idh/MocA family oxidoreductase [Chloroflexota bacterium]
MPKKLRLGIVGLDHWYAGLAVAEDAARNENVELVAIAHRDEPRGRETVERFGAGEYTADYMALATRGDLDVVATACYCSENAPLAAAAAKAGSHVLSVKPIAMTAAEAETIREAVRAAGVRFMSFESNYRITPTFRQIKEWVDGGRIGKVISAYTVLRSGLPTQQWPGVPGRTWWLDPTKTPGGGWIDHSIYHVDFLRWLLNDEVARVGGDVANLKHEDIAPLEDYGLAQLTFRGGARATVEVTWTGASGAGLNRIDVVGTEGQIVWDPTVSGKTALSGKTDPSGWLLTSTPARAASALAHLAETLAGRGQTAGTVDDACANLAVCEAFYRAAREGRATNL